MKGSKAMGPDDIPIEVWRCQVARAIVWLSFATSFFGQIGCLKNGTEVLHYYKN